MGTTNEIKAWQVPAVVNSGSDSIQRLRDRLTSGKPLNMYADGTIDIGPETRHSDAPSSDKPVSVPVTQLSAEVGKISRADIETKLNGVSANSLTEILTESLAKVQEEDFSNSERENPKQDDKESEDIMLSSFMKSHVKHYLLIADASLLSREVKQDYEVQGIKRDETEKYYMLEKEADGHHIPYEVNSHGLIVTNEHFKKLLNKSVQIDGYDYFGTFINNGYVFYGTDKDRPFIAMNEFELVTRLFSRNSGLLESSQMNDMWALIVGAGSVGSYVALELARAGVGHIILCDTDTLEVHNICRHQLGFRDLGRYKVDALKDAILNINPYADVKTYRGTIQELPEEFLDDFQRGIIIGTGDNRESSAYANDLAEKLNVPFVSTGCWERAHAGEVFFWIPNESKPKYREAFKDLLSNERPSNHQHYFANDNDEKNLKFEPGISTDIEFVSNVAVKVIYDLLNRNSEGYTKRVINYLKDYTLVCNTNETSIGGENAEMFPHPLFISNTITCSG